jgi:pyruvate formate lyase activating enzyme
VSEFFQRLHAAGVHTALDTCGLASADALAAVLPHTDHVLFDIKLLDSALHKRYTGQPNETILANLAKIAATIRKVNGDKNRGDQNREKNGEKNREMKLWIRTPLIPDTTAMPENMVAISSFIRDHLLDVTERWELCAFNTACKSKYQKMGLTWAYADYPLLGQRVIDTLKEAALSTGIPADKLVVSGLFAKE